MAKQISSKLSNPAKLFLLLFAGALLVSVYSCTSFSGSAADKKKTIKFHYLRYDSSALAYWLTVDKKTKGLALQFYSTDGSTSETPFGAVSYALDSTTGGYYTPPDTLKVLDSTAKSFDGKIILGNSWISRGKLMKIFFKDGVPRAFDYVMLVPKLDADGYRHVVYDLRVFKGTTQLIDVFLGGDESKPSPPAPPEN